MRRNTYNTDIRQQRKDRVLRHIVSEYVCTAVPVSSKTVARKMKEKISSATVRNIMVDLEKEGYIEQPHTSAGRVPTNAGYRKYVDYIQNSMIPEHGRARRLASEYDERIRTIKDIVERTSYLISRELHNPGVVMWPNIKDQYLKHIELVKVKAQTILAVLVTMASAVRNYVIQLEEDINAAALEKVANYINHNYEHDPISEIADDLEDVLRSGTVREENNGDIAHMSRFVIDNIIDEDVENEIYWEGLNYLVDTSASRDPEMARRILQVFADRRDLARILYRDMPFGGMRVYIGGEETHGSMEGCSIVTCGYSIKDRPVGCIGVIGPTRMDYMNALVTVNSLSELISMKLKELYEQEII